LEGLAHLYCEPLMFDKSDELLKKAETIYEEKGTILEKK
jgi:hypothetical protein